MPCQRPLLSLIRQIYSAFIRVRKLLTFLFTLVCIPALAQADQTGPAVTPETCIDLLADSDFKDFTVHLNPLSPETKREKIWWINEDGHLHVGGRGLGYIRTNQRYRDYHCVFEYKWGERTWARRSDRARDCGLLVHGHGCDGEFNNTWIRSIEAQLIEGGSGDILVLAGRPNDGDSLQVPTRLTAEVREDRDGETVWSAGGVAQTFPPEGRPAARINWKNRSPDWADIKGFRGKEDVENPVGEWNRLELICRGDAIKIYLNGVLVNAATGASPTAGYICLQSELAECIIRRYELHPLDSFHEIWKPAIRATDTGYSISGESILPRELPLSPAESQKLWRIDSDRYEIQLIAAEPITCDPVDVVWDAQGRMFVAEMGDYPTPASLPGFLSRIRLLHDRDGDGRMDEATTWADELDHVQGLLPMKGGLLATTRTAILFLKDTNNDGRADRRDVLFSINEPGHSQLQVACPRWGLDNAIYLNNGIDGKEIHPASKPNERLNFAGLDLRYDPYRDTLETITGRGQFGASFDDFGRRFSCSNRNPTMFAVMPLEAVKRNPLAGIMNGHEDIQPPGAPVWPVALSHTTSAAHAGTHTSACGLAVYRADVMPELKGNLFVCDPTAQLVTRNQVVPQGASFLTTRIGDRRDFLASGDEWCRPVHIRNGPDGALYICDMYRRFIDHAKYFPEDFQKTNYMRAGLDQGRIWRLVPKGRKSEPPRPLPASTAELIAELESTVAWRRTHAQRLLVEQNDVSAVGLLEKLLTHSRSPTARVHAGWTLQGLGQLKAGLVAKLLGDENLGVAENAIILASQHFAGEQSVIDQLSELTSHSNERIRYLAAIYAVPGQIPPQGAEYLRRAPHDVWMRRAFASSFARQAASALAELLSDQSFVADHKPGHAETLEYLGMLVAAQGDLHGIATALQRLGNEPTWIDFAVLNGFNAGLAKSSLTTKSLAELIARPPARLGAHATRIQAVLEDASSIAVDRARPAPDRIAALPLVTQRPFKQAMPVVEAMISPFEPSEIQSAACRSLSRYNRDDVAKFFFQRWKNLPPTPKREAIELITSNQTLGLALMRRMKSGDIARTLMPPMSRWVYGRSSNQEVRALAIELFGQGSSNRAQIIREYRAELSKQRGDPARGRAVFAKASCIECHKAGETGSDVGPSLADLRIKPAEALLTDILDPNRAVAQRWTSATVMTVGGLAYSGLVEADDVAGVTLRMPLGITKTVPRNEIESFTSSGRSLMPEGFERTISKAEMADLIAFLKQR